ncbi:kinase [Lithospermum erythrorhizon]|uniref:Kinase n=1 Tax=Lithospermum erythrorhizon TaxID=34254 RepID=A0AAV3RN26_LITER
MKAQTIDQLHSLQMKKSQPGTPLNGSIHGGAAFASLEKERQIQQLQSISSSLASLTRETGPKVVRGDPAKKADASSSEQPAVVPSPHTVAATITSDSALKFTHILYNLSPAGDTF